MKYYVNFDRLAGPRSRHFNLSVPFDSFQEADEYLDMIISKTETAKDKMRIQHDAVILNDQDLDEYFQRTTGA